MLAAAAAWDALATELYSAAVAYRSAISGLTSGGWRGPSSASMAGAAAPYVQWMSTTAAQAEQTATQAKAAAAAYETAFAATVPPPVIAANRSLLASLVATNILGLNTAAIAATEAHYAEMWAQDAAAMFGYAGSSAAATQLTTFTSPPPTTNNTGGAAQSAALAHAAGTSASSTVQTQLSHLVSMLPNTLQGLATTTSTSASLPTGPASGLSSITALMENLTGAYSPIGLATIPGGWWLTSGQILKLGQNGAGLASLLGPAKPITGVLAPLVGEVNAGTSVLGPAGLGRGAVSGAMGRANLVGSLSVPTGWASAAPAVRTVASVLPASGLGAAAPMTASLGAEGMFGPMALSSLAGRALGGTAARSVGGTAACITGGAVTEGVADPASATIIVIPPSEE